MEDKSTDALKNQKKRKVEAEVEEVHQPFTKKRKISFDLETNLVLPQEIMLEILEYLDPEDLRIFSEVCKYWLTCSLSMVGWTFVDAAELYSCHCDEKYKSRINMLFEDRILQYNERQIGARVKVKRLTEEGTKYAFYDNEGEMIATLDRQYWWTPTSGLTADYFGPSPDLLNPNIHPGWRVDIHIARKPEWNQKGYWYQTVMKFYVNAKMYEHAVYSGEDFPKKELIHQYGVVREVNSTLDKEYKRIAALPTAMFPYASICMRYIKRNCSIWLS